MYLKLFKIFLIWGILLVIVGEIISFISSFIATIFYGSHLLVNLVAIPFSIATGWFAGYKAVKASQKIANVQKITTPYATGILVGFVSMLIDSALAYILFREFHLTGILIMLAAGFGGKMAGGKR